MTEYFPMFREGIPVIVKRLYKFNWLLCIYCVLALATEAQQDSSFLDKVNLRTKNKFLNGIFEDAKNSIRRNQFDAADNKAVLLTQSEESFKPYEGKIIRRILVNSYGFERSFTDTANRIQYFGTKILNALHTDSREFVIRDNLYIRENTKLNPYILADNERFLRNISFIQDARIIVTPVGFSGDSVDVLVFTKDLFSLKLVADVAGFDVEWLRMRLSESNIGGTAQSLQLTGLWQRGRKPGFGYEAAYGKTNIGGSFVNGSVGYTTANTGRSDGDEEEYSLFFRMDRPLVSPYSQLAGGMEISFNQSVNVQEKPDSIFFDYRYNLYDIWGGINLGITDIREGIMSDNRRDRKFLSGRYLQSDFLKTPLQIGDSIDPVYNSRQMALLQFTFFRQEYYKMNYLYGFGTTEDIPTGYNLALTAGWHRQLTMDRPYGGVEFDKYFVTDKGGFLHASLRTGGFYRKQALEDASLLVGANYFTALLPLKKWKIRQQFRASYTQIHRRNTYFPLYLNNAYGPPNFNTAAVSGHQRISAYTESVLYLNKKIFGFLFAPFAYAATSVLTPEYKRFREANVYPSFGGGLRTRNENLIFGTIEFKALYFPKPVQGLQGFQFYINSDIRFRYRTSFVKAPNTVQLNFEDIY